VSLKEGPHRGLRDARYSIASIICNEELHMVGAVNNSAS
jgi:hypothetical protein